jgi:hypothetical protein
VAHVDLDQIPTLKLEKEQTEKKVTKKFDVQTIKTFEKWRCSGKIDPEKMADKLFLYGVKNSHQDLTVSYFKFVKLVFYYFRTSAPRRCPRL